MNNDTNIEKNSIIKRGILGCLIGLAVIVPGISGSTIAILFKLYDQILDAVANIFKKFKKSTMFLLPLLVGAIIGVVIGFFSVQKLLELIPFAIVVFFAGLMLGALPSLKDELDSSKTTPKTKYFAIIGFLIPITIATLSIVFKTSTQQNLTINLWTFIFYLILGFIVALTQFVPGASATATLMAFGYFIPLMNSFHMSYWKENPSIFLVYLALAIGFLLGCFIISKGLNSLLQKYKNLMYYLFIGLSFGSIVTMFFNVDMLEIYQNWANNGINLLDLLLGIGLFIIGLIISYNLVLYMRRKSKKESV